MSIPILSLREVGLDIGHRTLFDHVTLHLRPGERYCLLGRNGAGKSTLMKLMHGMLTADRGERYVQPGARVALLGQQAPAQKSGTALEVAAEGLAEDDQYQARLFLSGLGIEPDAEYSSLSGGGQRRVMLAAALAQRPDVLLLDEPTNHLDILGIAWLEEEILSFTGALVVISHDRRFLERITNRMLWLDRASIRGLDRGFAHFAAWQEEMLEREATEAQKLSKKLTEEEHWLRYGVTARRKRNERRVANLHDLRDQLRGAQANLKRGESKVEALSMETARGSERVLTLSGVSCRFPGSERPLLEHVNLALSRGHRLGIVGANGSGKTTLLSLITGDIEPSEGTVTRGASVTISYADQQRQSLNPEDSVREVLCPGGGDHVEVGGVMKHVASYLKDFLFEASQAQSPVSSLSGGEANRLMLARLLARPGNLLILDEPTNDLDMDTLEVLLEMLEDYKGTLIVVSHDRDFIDRLTTHCWVLPGDGQVVPLVGGFQEAAPFLFQKRKGADDSAAQSQKSAPKPNASKMSYKLVRELEQLPKQIAVLEQEILALETSLEDADFYSKNPKGFAAASTRLPEARHQLSIAEERWLELEMLRAG